MYQEDARVALEFAAADYKLRYDAQHKPIKFNVEDEVYLRLHEGYTLPGNATKLSN